MGAISFVVVHSSIIVCKYILYNGYGSHGCNAGYNAWVNACQLPILQPEHFLQTPRRQTHPCFLRMRFRLRHSVPVPGPPPNVQMTLNILINGDGAMCRLMNATRECAAFTPLFSFVPWTHLRSSTIWTAGHAQCVMPLVMFLCQ